MNGRIYSQEVFEKALLDLQRGEMYCSNCFSNDLDYKERDTNIVYIHDYKCYSCFNMIHKSDILSKSQVREKKIDRVLKK